MRSCTSPGVVTPLQRRVFRRDGLERIPPTEGPFWRLSLSRFRGRGGSMAGGAPVARTLLALLALVAPLRRPPAKSTRVPGLLRGRARGSPSEPCPLLAAYTPGTDVEIAPRLMRSSAKRKVSGRAPPQLSVVSFSGSFRMPARWRGELFGAQRRQGRVSVYPDGEMSGGCAGSGGGTQSATSEEAGYPRCRLRGWSTKRSERSEERSERARDGCSRYSPRTGLGPISPTIKR